MKRRAFTFGLGALAAAPALPITATATAAAGSASATAQHFTVAKLIARAHNHCTVDMLQRHLKVSPDMARQVRGLLLEKGVITTPVGGVSMATNPLNTNCVPAQALKPTNIAQSALDVRKRVRKVLDEHKARLSELLDDTDAEEDTTDPEAEPRNPET